jgi:NIPSNAP
VFQLRIYTLRSAPTLDRYATVHWARHIPSLAKFGVTTHGFWTQRDEDGHRLVALISYPDGADPAAVTRDFMASAEFASDMEGFDPDDIVAVDTMALQPAPSSPMR